MARIQLVFYVSICCCLSSFARAANDGLSPATAFVTLAQARSVTADGTYFFNLSGTPFSTFVNTDGQVLAAVDFGLETGALPQTSSLDTPSRGILAESVLSTFTDISEIRILSTTGNIDVTTDNATLLGRIAGFDALTIGLIDAPFQTDWSGVGQSAFFMIPTQTTCDLGGPLDVTVFHACGDPTSFYWFPERDSEIPIREAFNQGDVPASVSFQMYTGSTANPSISVTKIADKTDNVPLGDTITYTYVVTNTGNVTISNVTLADVHNGFGPAPVPTSETLSADNALTGDSTDLTPNDGVWTSLAPFDSVTFTGTYVVTQADIDNLQ